jgi:hypothetical protein
MGLRPAARQSPDLMHQLHQQELELERLKHNLELDRTRQRQREFLVNSSHELASLEDDELELQLAEVNVPTVFDQIEKLATEQADQEKVQLTFARLGPGYWYGPIR